MVHDDMTHLVCDRCWRELRPLRRPVRVVESERRACCRCGAPTESGIFVRAGRNEWGRCVDA